jgi:cathepsin L
LIDCGNGRFAKMNGCNGGIQLNVPDFVESYGLELAELYPYVGEEQECPYQDPINILRTGFIRMPLGSILDVPIDLWPEHLEQDPLYVAVGIPNDFHQYGGGVHDGQGCIAEGIHAMVVVGHGRETGKEFWLLRNSYGSDWGDEGYFKLAKSAQARCIEREWGYAYGVKEKLKYPIRPFLNLANERVIELAREKPDK